MKLLARLLGCMVIGLALTGMPARGQETLPTPTPAAVEAQTPAHDTAEVPKAGVAARAPGTSKEVESGSNPLLEETKNIWSYVFTIAVFVVLLLILRFTAWKPILAALRAREAAIRDSIEAASRARAEAEKTTRELEARIAEAQRQGAQALLQAKADAQKISEAIKAQAEAESVAMKDRALREIAAAKQQAVSEINAHAAELGTAVARKILQRQVTVEDQQRLVDESLAELGTSKL